MVREEGDSRVSAPLIICVEFSLALVLAIYLLYKYGNFRKQNPFVTVSTLVVWFLSFVIIFLLPIDVSSVSAIKFGSIILVLHSLQLPIFIYNFLGGGYIYMLY